MICDRCGKNEANIHIMKMVKGEKTETWLCGECAKEDNEIGIFEDFNKNEISVQNILGGLMDYITNISDKVDEKDTECENCGLTYREFKNTGLLGCSECYGTFSKYLTAIIKRVQGDCEHEGKIPQRIGKGLITEKQVKKLKQELQKCILEEAYEDAAIIRDKIKLLQKKE